MVGAEGTSARSTDPGGGSIEGSVAPGYDCESSMKTLSDLLPHPAMSFAAAGECNPLPFQHPSGST